MALSRVVFSQGQRAAASIPESWSEGSPLGLFVGLVVVPPLIETLVECTGPYWLFSRLRGYRRNRPKRCWGFIVVSASMMALLHPILAALMPAFVTGAFLAYCYQHFAPVGIWRAIAGTWAFHGAINLVGWTMLVAWG
jgi:hypothetical protein